MVWPAVILPEESFSGLKQKSLNTITHIAHYKINNMIVKNFLKIKLKKKNLPAAVQKNKS